MGGLISTYAACRYPDIFTKVAAISSGYFRNQEEMEKMISSANLTNIKRFYLDCGTNEFGESEINSAFLQSNQTVYEMINRKVSNSMFRTIDNGKHEYTFFKKRIPEIMTYLFAE